MFLLTALSGRPFPPETKGYYLQLLSWVLLLAYFSIGWRKGFEFLGLIASPLAVILFLSAFRLTAAPLSLPSSLTTLFFGLHIGALFLSLGLLLMAFSAGALFLHVEKRIKTKEKLTGFRKDLPALATFDRINHWAVVCGFPLFTLGLISGFAWARTAWENAGLWDPKEVTSIVIWILFALLFHQRLALGWRGRKPALLAMLLFLFSAASLVGVNLFLPTHHSLTP